MGFDFLSVGATPLETPVYQGFLFLKKVQCRTPGDIPIFLMIHIAHCVHSSVAFQKFVFLELIQAKFDTYL
jgi:hypothetical protein